MYDLTLDTAALDWLPTPWAGVTMKRLRDEPAAGLTRLAPGATVPAHRHTRAEQTVFVIEGDLIDAGTTYGPGTFFVATADAPHGPHGPHGSTGGCVLLTIYRGPVDFVTVD